MLAEIDHARDWEELSTDDRSPTVLKRLAAQALAKDEAGLTEPLEALLAELESRPSSHLTLGVDFLHIPGVSRPFLSASYVGPTPSSCGS